MKLELLKQTKIDINIYDFTDKLLKLYYSKIPADGNTFNDEINSVVKEITGYDLYDYDNTYEVMEHILDRAIIYAVSWHYPQIDIFNLNRIASLI